MKERPILFSAPMVLAILAGRKTKTRRIIKDDLWACLTPEDFEADGDADPGEYCPHGAPGDRLWLREAWRTRARLDEFNATEIAASAIDAGFPSPSAGHPACPLRYEADGRALVWGSNDFVDFGDWGRPRLARFMPRWASRLTLEITSVRVERLQSISEEDAKAEGVSTVQFRPDDGYPICDGYMAGPDDGKSGLATTARGAFEKLWRTIHGDKPGARWEDSPWVWCIEFRRTHEARDAR